MKILPGKITALDEPPCTDPIPQGAVKKRIAIQRIFTHKKHRACPGKTDTLFLYVRAKNVLIFNDSVIARPSGRGDLLVKYANLKRSTRRLPRRFAARNDGVDDGWHLYPRKCIASICIRVSLQPLFCFRYSAAPAPPGSWSTPATGACPAFPGTPEFR